ncbi:MAG: NAD(P)-dependent oxidoreductase [Sphingomonadales bacterium]|nr:NAD(P)-dependent oxidoreductase [Sphingomonadales bacterium]
MKLLVTGSSGLVGSVLVERLREEGHEVRLYDLRPKDGAPSRDLRDEATLREAVADCDGVYHLAAVSRVAWGEEAPEICADINVRCTRLLVDAMLAQGRPWLVFASSREVYGDPASRFVTESDPVAPLNEYGRSKAAAERIVSEGQAQGLRTATLRLSNVYGTMNDHPDRAVPALLWRAHRGDPIELTGGDNYFDFVHVDDSVAGLKAAGDRLAAGQEHVPTVHLSTGVETSLIRLAERATKLCNSSSRIERLPARSFDVSGFCGDPALAGKVLDWRARISLEEGMARLLKLMVAQGAPIPPAFRPGPQAQTPQ